MAGKERKLVAGNEAADGGVGTTAIAELTIENSMENCHNIWVSFACSTITGGANMNGGWAVWAIRTSGAKRTTPSASLANLIDDDNQDILIAAGLFVASNESPWSSGSISMGNISRNLPKGGRLVAVCTANGITSGNVSIDALLMCNSRVI